jgi:hypothetical protein
MKRFVAAWCFLFFLAAGILVAWECVPHGRDDIEIYLLPACFLLLSVWAMAVRHRELSHQLASLRFDIHHPMRTDLMDDSDTFKHLFDGY